MDVQQLLVARSQMLDRGLAVGGLQKPTLEVQIYRYRTLEFVKVETGSAEVVRKAPPGAESWIA